MEGSQGPQTDALDDMARVRAITCGNGRHHGVQAEIENPGMAPVTLLRRTLSRSREQTQSNRLMLNTIRVTTSSTTRDDDALTKAMADAVSAYLPDTAEGKTVFSHHCPRGILKVLSTASSTVFDVKVSASLLRDLAVTQPTLIYEGRRLTSRIAWWRRLLVEACRNSSKQKSAPFVLQRFR